MYYEPEPTPDAPPPPRKWRLRLRAGARALPAVGFGVLLMLLLLVLYNLVNPAKPPLTTRDVATVIARHLASATPPPAVAARVYEIVRPSLVLIETHVLGSNGKVEGALGSGVILDESGAILTSLHVVQQAIDIQVTFADGTESAAILIVAQTENDIALLRALNPPKEIIPATLGNARALQPGDDAIVAGNPLGLIGSVSAGVISGLNRSFQPPGRDTRLRGLIQFDAAVNPGNSGGPLLNRDGEVVGIVTGLVNPSGQDAFAGIGFAVPIEAAAAAGGPPPY